MKPPPTASRSGLPDAGLRAMRGGRIWPIWPHLLWLTLASLTGLGVTLLVQARSEERL